MPPLIEIARHAGTLILATCAGWVFELIGVPLPWFLGPIIVVGLMSLAGAELATPQGSRQGGQILLATGIGLQFTPMVASYLIGNLVVMLVAAIGGILIGTLAGRLLRSMAQTDAATAHFSCMPGGVAEMANLAEHFNGKTAPVALAQSLRLFFIVVTIPPALMILDFTGSDLFARPDFSFQPLGLFLLLIMTTASALLMARVKSANPWIIGPVLVAASLTVLDVHFSSMPSWMMSAAQILIASSLGLRYRRDTVVALRRFLPPVLVSMLVLIGGSIILALVLAPFSGIPNPSLVLATAPGGVAEMAITAEVLNLGVPLITAFHLLRVVFVVTLSGPIFRLARRL
ncbi:MAG: AbrB family transcriptional regulator [Rhodospirillaceae bacterium]